MRLGALTKHRVEEMCDAVVVDNAGMKAPEMKSILSRIAKDLDDKEKLVMRACFMAGEYDSDDETHKYHGVL